MSVGKAAQIKSLAGSKILGNSQLLSDRVMLYEVTMKMRIYISYPIFLTFVLAIGLAQASTFPDQVGPGPIPLTNTPQYAGRLLVNETIGAEMFYW